MCGICGFITETPSKDNAKYFKRILYMSETRGHEATGIFYTKNEKCIIQKQPIAASKFIEDVMPNYLEDLENTQVAFGHTRFPTQGSPTDNNNNHPVESQNWIMVHNGNVTKMPRLPGYKYKGEVDSEILLSYIEKYGLKDGLPHVERGSAAVAVVNKNDLNTIYLWREVNPIVVACDANAHTLFFASQEEFLTKGLANQFLLFTSFQVRDVPANLLIKITKKPFAITSMGYVKVMAYNASNYSFPSKIPNKQKVTDNQLDNLIFNNTTHRWELPPDNKSTQNVINLPKYLKSKQEEKYLKDNGFTDSEIARMAKETVCTIMYCGYNGTDIAITNDGRIHLLSKSTPHMLQNSTNNKYYLKAGMSKDFKNWERLSKPNKGHISICGELYKRWDDEKKAHYIMTIDDAIKEQLIDANALQADIDLTTSDILEIPNMED